MRFSKRTLWLWLWLSLLLLSVSPSASAQTARFDLSFKHWGEFYFPWEDWHWWKAQGIAESGLNPSLTGPSGDAGIMQMIPTTQKAMGVKDPLDAEESIQGGIKYDRILWDSWKVSDAAQHRNFTFGSYNAGLGSIQKAAKLVEKLDWSSIAAALSQVTGRWAITTVRYVNGINATHAGMR